MPLPELVKTSMPGLEIARGNASRLSKINKFGQNPTIASATQEDIWDGGTNYTFPTTADITHIRQAVDQPAMRGKLIETFGVDIAWGLVTQTTPLDAANTTTPVALTTPLLRSYRMRVNANVVTDQNIELRNVGGGTTYAIIQAAKNQTLMAITPVPAGKVGYITEYHGSVAITAANNPNNTIFGIWVADRGNSYEFRQEHVVPVTKEVPHFLHPFDPPLPVPTMSDIKMTAQPSNKPANAYGGFTVIFEDLNP